MRFSDIIFYIYPPPEIGCAAPGGAPYRHESLGEESCATLPWGDRVPGLPKLSRELHLGVICGQLPPQAPCTLHRNVYTVEYLFFGTGLRLIRPPQTMRTASWEGVPGWCPGWTTTRRRDAYSRETPGPAEPFPCPPLPYGQSAPKKGMVCYV